MELTTIDILIRLVIALLLGSLLGIERTLAGKTAGMRTYALVSMGSALFALISLLMSEKLVGTVAFNPIVLGPAIISGIGFIGAGLVFHNSQDMRTSGLTSAAGLWVAAGVGMATGFGYALVALMAALLTLLVFTVMWYIEKDFKKLSYSDEKSEKENSERFHE